MKMKRKRKKKNSGTEQLRNSPLLSVFKPLIHGPETQEHDQGLFLRTAIDQSCGMDEFVRKSSLK